MGLTLGIVVALLCGACEQQSPPPKPIGAATNKHVEEAPGPPSRVDADAMIQRMKTPMENARQTEDRLKDSADRVQQQSESITP
jgi:hypothetical protein